MPSTSLPFATDIAAPPATVFRYVADLSRHEEWAANPLQIELISGGALINGNRYRSVAQVRGVRFEAELCVTEYEPPVRFAFTGEDTTGQFTHQFTFEPQADGTHVERKIIFTLTPRQWFMFYLLLLPVRLPAGRRAMQLLKAGVEALA